MARLALANPVTADKIEKSVARENTINNLVPVGNVSDKPVSIPDLDAPIRVAPAGIGGANVILMSVSEKILLPGGALNTVATTETGVNRVA